MTKEALKLALEALEKGVCVDPEDSHRAIYVIREALAQPQQEPVALFNAIRAEPTEMIHKWRVIDIIQSFPSQGIYYTPPAQPQQEIDWKDQYEKQKRRAEMWVAKYEADIGPLEMAGPVTAQQQEPVATMTVREDMGANLKFNRSHTLLPGQKLHLYTSPPARKPLTQTEVVEGFCKQPHDVQFVSVFNAGVRFAEAAHGIKEDRNEA